MRLLKKYIIKIFYSNLYYKAYLYVQQFENYKLEFSIKYEHISYNIYFRRKGSDEEFVKFDRYFWSKSDAIDFISENQNVHDYMIECFIRKNQKPYVSKESKSLKKLNIIDIL